MRRYDDPIEVRSTVVTTPGVPDVPDASGASGAPRGTTTSSTPTSAHVELVDAPPGTPAGSDEEPLVAPQAFIWHGRLYVVRRVLSRWRERRAWWRDALDPQPGQETGIAVASREQQVWRVEASAGRAAGTGVFDLVHDAVSLAGESDWRLVRVAD